MNHQSHSVLNNPAETPTNFKDLCRLCGLKTVESSRVNIFQSTGALLHLETKIIDCLQLDIYKSDILPKVICYQCLQSLEKLSAFKINCKKINDFLLTLVRNTEYVSETNNIINSCASTELKTNMPVVRVDGVKNRSLLRNNQNSSQKIVTTTSNCKLVKVDIENFQKIHCQLCSTIFVNKSDLENHFKHTHLTKIKKIKKKVKCNICNKSYANNCVLRVHIKSIHTKEFDFMCDICGQEYITKFKLENHIRSKHTKERPFKCEHCSNNFTSKLLLQKHINNMHNNDSTVYTCNICKKSFRTSRYLIIHKKIHEIPIEKRKKHKCYICGASYEFLNKLKIHMRSHTGETPFNCNLCEKGFKNKAGLNIHMLTHSGERNHVCEICGSAFALSKNLNVHRFTVHERLKKYSCNDCGRSYTQNSSLNLHLKKSGHTKVKRHCNKLTTV